jgi:photosystem II stability/assembly factor-like uncharacterized protein
MAKMISVILILVGLLISASGPLLSSENVFCQINPSDRLFAVKFRDEKVGWLLGDMGLVLKTTDGGNGWQKVTMPVNDALYDITFVEQNCWIIGA